MNKLFVAASAAFFVVCTPAVAQWQIPDHAVPIGRGAGVTGFKSAVPGTSGLPLLSNGASADPSFSALNLSATGAVTGTLPVGNGGTGSTSFSAHGVLLGNGTDPVGVITACENGVLHWAGSAVDPTCNTRPFVLGITGAAPGATFNVGPGTYAGATSGLRVMGLLGSQATPDNTQDATAVFQKWANKSDVGVTQNQTVYVEMVKTGSANKAVAMFAEAADITGGEGTFVEGSRSHGYLASGTTTGSAFGAISSALALGSGYEFLIGHEADIWNVTGTDAPVTINLAKIATAFNCSVNGPGKIDACYITNPYNAATARVGFLVLPNSVDQAAFRSSAATVYGLDLTNATMTYAMVSPGFTLGGVTGAGHLALFKDSGYESARVQSNTTTVDFFANSSTGQAGLLAQSTQSISLVTNAGSATLDPSGNLAVSAALTTGSPIGLTYGGTGANLSATGGTSHVLRQSSAGAAVTVSQLSCADLSDATACATGGAALTKTDDTNVTMTLGGTPSAALLQATSITLGWTGQLGVSRGGTGQASLTAHAFLTGNGTSGVNQVAITGLVKGNGGSAPSAYPGTSCTNQFPRSLDANGAATCASVAIGADVSGLGSGIATWLATPSSANLAAAVTDETGSGALVFATSPTLVTPTLGVAAATSINKMAITAPASGSTLAVADGKTFTVSRSLTLTGTDSTTMTFPATSQTIAGLGVAQTFTTKQAITANSTSGPGGLAIDVTQTQPNSSDIGDAGLSLSYTLSASSATNELVPRGFALTFTNNLTGGGAITAGRMMNLAAFANSGTTTSVLDNIYMDAASAGTVGVHYGLHIVGLIGATKWGIYDESGANSFFQGYVRADGGFRVSGDTGLSSTISVRKGDDSGACNLVVSGGIITSTTC